MYSGITPPSFPSAVIQTFDQNQPHVSNPIDAQDIGGGEPISNPIAADIHGQPFSYGDLVNFNQNSLNQFQAGTFSRGLDHHSGWYSTDGQPPSIGGVRPIVISVPSGSNEMYTDGLPPSFNDFGTRGTSLTGASAGGEVPEAYDLAGMSLTATNFRRLHPEAFSKDQDGN